MSSRANGVAISMQMTRVSERPSRPETPGSPGSAEKKEKKLSEAEGKDAPNEGNKARIFPQDLERRTFQRDKVIFTKDAWGRSVVKVMNPTQRKAESF